MDTKKINIATKLWFKYLSNEKNKIYSLKDLVKQLKTDKVKKRKNCALSWSIRSFTCGSY